jgi:hypothetical protein
MPNYIRLIGEHYPTLSAHVLANGDPTVYGDIIWDDTPIAQATLDALVADETLVSEVVAQLAALTIGDILQWDGNFFVPLAHATGDQTGEIPFFNQDTTQDNIALTGLGKIPFFNQDTSSDPIDLV